MDNITAMHEILAKCNYKEISSKTSDFVNAYIRKLIVNIVAYVNSDITVGDIQLVKEFYANRELSQEITGVPSAYSAIDADEDVLTKFADEYSKMGVKEYDSLAKESLLDFLNLHNGLFVVELSKSNICELMLSAPKQNGAFLMTSPVTGAITVIPVKFPYGEIKFLLCETDK